MTDREHYEPWHIGIEYQTGTQPFWKCWPEHRTALHDKDFIRLDMPCTTNILNVRRAASIMFDLIEQPEQVKTFTRQDWLRDAESTKNNSVMENTKDKTRVKIQAYTLKPGDHLFINPDDQVIFNYFISWMVTRTFINGPATIEVAGNANIYFNHRIKNAEDIQEIEQTLLAELNDETPPNEIYQDLRVMNYQLFG